MRAVYRAFQTATILVALILATVYGAESIRGANFVETGTGAQGSGGVLIDDNSWLMHRFQVTQTTQLATIGGNFQSYFPSPIELFGAVVSLSGPSDYPDSNDLSTADRLGTTLLSVPRTGPDGQDFTAPLELTLDPGWYGMVFGTDGFGAGSAPEFELGMKAFSIDSAPTQSPVSLFQPDHPWLPNARVNQLFSPRFLATAGPAPPEVTTLTPYVDAVARLQEGGFTVTDGETAIGTQYLPIAAVDRRGILEFDMSQIPRGSTISSVQLDLDVASFTHNSLDQYPSPRIYGYAGDGYATPADATRTANLLLETEPITELGRHTFDLDPAFFASHVNLQGYGGLLIRGSENGRQMQFRASESPGAGPRLNVSFTPPEDPLPALGDYNGNGYPDTADYTVWRNTLHSTTDRRADGDNDGVVGASDYAIWKNAYANTLHGLTNGDFGIGDLTNWKKIVTANADISAGFPRVEAFDVDGNGQADPAMRIRVGQVAFDPAIPAGGGIEQTFVLDSGGDYSLSTLFASTNLDTIGNGGPGRYELYFDEILVDFEDLNGTLISPGQVIRGSLQSMLHNVSPGMHSVKLLYLRPAVNSREIYGFFDNVSLILGAGAAANVPEPATANVAVVAAISMFFFVRRSSTRYEVATCTLIRADIAVQKYGPNVCNRAARPTWHLADSTCCSLAGLGVVRS